MKNKKGFTLIEILVVIAIVGAVGVSSTIVFTATTEKMKETKLNKTIEEIELATDVYFNMNDHLMKSLYESVSENKTCTRIYILQNERLIDKVLKNPVTDEVIPGNLCVYSYLDANGNIVHEFSL